MNQFLEKLLEGIITLEIIPVDGPPGARVNFVLSLLSNALILLLTGIIIVAIVYAALAGLKYIQSQGESDKVEEAQNAIRSTFIGVLAAFVGIIAVIVISGIFTNPAGTEVRQALCVFLEPNAILEECIENVEV